MDDIIYIYIYTYLFILYNVISTAHTETLAPLTNYNQTISDGLQN